MRPPVGAGRPSQSPIPLFLQTLPRASWVRVGFERAAALPGVMEALDGLIAGLRGTRICC